MVFVPDLLGAENQPLDQCRGTAGARPADRHAPDLGQLPGSLRGWAESADAAGGIARSLVNIVVETVGATLLTLVIAVVGAYAFARMRFRLKGPSSTPSWPR